MVCWDARDITIVALATWTRKVESHARACQTSSRHNMSSQAHEDSAWTRKRCLQMPALHVLQRACTAGAGRIAGGRTGKGDKGIGEFVITEGEATSLAHFKHVEEVFWTHRASLLETRVTLHAASSSFVVSVGIVVGPLLVIAERLQMGPGVVSEREVACYPYEPGACCIHSEGAPPGMLR